MRKSFMRVTWTSLLAVILLMAALFHVVPLATKAETPDTGLPILEGEWRARLPELLTGKAFPLKSTSRLMVGGEPFGIRLLEEGVLIVGLAGQGCPASQAGIQKQDRILSINGKTVKSVKDVLSCIDGCEGKPLEVVYRHKGQELTCQILPERGTDNQYKIGIWVRDNAAGIGTITYIDPETGAFGGLGHGICDADTGDLIPLSRGAILKTEIAGVVKGTEGSPGELKGYLQSEKIGVLQKNCERGVFGILSPTPAPKLEDMMEVAKRSEVHEGLAYLRCTLGGCEKQDYEVELSNIHFDNHGIKSFSIHVLDPKLIEKTGGIVQGMSGSPILQDGKLVGAVTHVLVGDPTRGYGIFLENMLEAMEAT